MEELVTLQYGSFTILGKRAKEFTQRTSCSKRAADQTLQGQFYLSELRRAPELEHCPTPGMGSLLAGVPDP